MIDYKLNEKYKELVTYVEDRVDIEFRNDYMLSRALEDMSYKIFMDGNNLDTEKELIELLTDTDNKTIRQLVDGVGKFMIRHIVDKNYMEELVKTHKDEINERIIEDIKNNLDELNLEEIKEKEVLSQGHCSNMIDEEIIMDGENRVMTRTHVSRMTVADGAPYDNQVSVEIIINGDIVDTIEYEPM